MPLKRSPATPEWFVNHLHFSSELFVLKNSSELLILKKCIWIVTFFSDCGLLHRWGNQTKLLHILSIIFISLQNCLFWQILHFFSELFILKNYSEFFRIVYLKNSSELFIWIKLNSCIFCQSSSLFIWKFLEGEEGKVLLKYKSWEGIKSREWKTWKGIRFVSNKRLEVGQNQPFRLQNIKFWAHTLFVVEQLDIKLFWNS